MSDPEAFLREVADGLPFGERERAEIVEELRAHLDDTIAGLKDEGLASDLAQRTALGRLGPPARLARDLTQARRSTRRLLAAAGAGSWAVVTSGVYGAVVGLILATLAWFAAALLVRFVGPFAFDSLSFIAIGAGVYAAGSALVPIVAARAGYRGAPVRRVLAAGGAILLAIWALVGWSGPLDIVGVVAILSLPLWWIAGTWRRSRFGRGSWRAFGGLLIVAVVVTLTAQVAQSRLRDSVSPDFLANGGDLGLSRIGTPAPADIAALVTGTGELSGQGKSGVGLAVVTFDISDATKLADWTDFRIEAWRAADPGGMSPTPVSQGATAPFGVEPAAWSPPGQLPQGGLTWSGSDPWGPNAKTLSGMLRLDRTPWVTAAWVAITGVAPDGIRHTLGDPQFMEATFNGTALQWLLAVAGETTRLRRSTLALRRERPVRRPAHLDPGPITRERQ